MATEPAAASARKLRIALLQMKVTAGDPDENYRRAGDMLREAVAGGEKPDVILLPEMWNTGYALERIRELADEGGERTGRFIGDFCRRHGVNVIAGSIADKTGGRVRNTAYAFDRAGRLTADYSKIHLFRLMDEEKHLAAGGKPGLLSVDGQPAGLIICYDLRFPELTRRLALEGAKILFVPAEWPNPRLHHWRSLIIARAIENQMYVIACNAVGENGGNTFFGHSMIVDPWGTIVAEAGEEETILTAEVDLALADDVRAKIPVFEDRRPELYGL